MPYETHARAAWSLLQAHHDGTIRLTRQAGSFLGQLLTDPTPMSERQRDWLNKLLVRAGLAAFEEGGDD